MNSRRRERAPLIILPTRRAENRDHSSSGTPHPTNQRDGAENVGDDPKTELLALAANFHTHNLGGTDQHPYVSVTSVGRLADDRLQHHGHHSVSRSGLLRIGRTCHRLAGRRRRLRLGEGSLWRAVGFRSDLASMVSNDHRLHRHFDLHRGNGGLSLRSRARRKQTFHFCSHCDCLVGSDPSQSTRPQDLRAIDDRLRYPGRLHSDGGSDHRRCSLPRERASLVDTARPVVQRPCSQVLKCQRSLAPHHLCLLLHWHRGFRGARQRHEEPEPRLPNRNSGRGRCDGDHQRRRRPDCSCDRAR